ncbi:hypothetical protein [Demequina gelatinilytica]|uniref:hypothetical protein n=1 Tax=Demequina gelatinilytica TaxID=1638980 RepID=UPI000781EC9F|nr:hypothetical protein [Demequina gelatinilytica]
MPRRLLLEGADPEALLVRAREEHGPEARVVHAERVRTGGVLGFFAKDTYALTVEVPDQAPGRLRPASSLAGAGVGARDDADLDDELADVAAVSRELLASVARDAAPARRSAEAQDEFGALLARLVAEPREDAAQAEPLPPVPAWAVEPAVPAAEPATMRDFVPARFPVADAADRIVVREPARQAAPATDDVSVEASAPDRDADPTTDELLALGVPAALLEHDEPGSRIALASLVRGLDIVPQASAPGELLVVVGAPDRAFDVACQVARWRGMATTDVALAGDAAAVPGHGRRIRTAAAARSLRERAGGPDATARTIVALGIEAASDASLAAALVEALDAHACWAAVDADGRGGAPVESLIAAGSVDATAVAGLARSQEPGRALGDPLPVAWMDGVPATRVAWAARLDEALSMLRARTARA